MVLLIEWVYRVFCNVVKLVIFLLFSFVIILYFVNLVVLVGEFEYVFMMMIFFVILVGNLRIDFWLLEEILDRL